MDPDLPPGRPAPVLAMRAPPPQMPADTDYATLVQQATLAASVAASASLDPIREQDRLLPAANIFRIIQRELPEGCKISRDAKYFMQVRMHLGLPTASARHRPHPMPSLAAQEALSEFVCFLTRCVRRSAPSRRHRIQLLPPHLVCKLRCLAHAPLLPLRSQRGERHLPSATATHDGRRRLPHCAGNTRCVDAACY